MTRRKRTSLGVAGAAIALCVGVAIAAPTAQAASVTYANDQLTAHGVARTSHVLSSVVGGTARVSIGFGSTSVETFSPAPGYTTHGYASGDSPATVRLSHQRVSNAYSKCLWWFSNSIGGEASLTCTATT